MKPKLPRIPVLSTFALLLLITLVVLWVRSPRHADALLFYTPAGHITGLASDHGGIAFCATGIPAGEEMGLSADAMTGSADEFAPIHDTLFDTTAERWHFLGFHVAAGTIGTWGWKFNAILVPYWAMLIPLAILPLTGFRRVIVRARRKRRGQCLACGYDLRQSPERCPECGRPVGIGASATATLISQRGPTMGGTLSWLLAGALIAAGLHALRNGRSAATAAATTPPELALLDRRVRQVDLDDVPVARGLDVMARGCQTHVAIHWPSIEAERRSERIPWSFHFRDVRLGPAVRMVAFCPDGKGCVLWPYRAESSQVWADARAVHIGRVSIVPRMVRAYPVGGLLRQIENDLRHEEAESQPPPASTQPLGVVSNAVFTPGPFHAPPARDELVQFIQDAAQPDDWVYNGGALGALTVLGDRLWVYQTQEGHAAVRAVLALVAAAATDGPASPPAQPSGDENPHANLEQHISELKLESSTLGGAIDAVRQASHANILVYWDDLQSIGLRRDTPVKLHLWDITVDRALGAILTVAGGEYPAMRAVRDGAIVIALPEDLRRGSMSIRIYDVRDLIEKYLTERRALRPNTDRIVNDAPPPGTYEDMVDRITRLIEDAVNTDSWRDNGGSVGEIRELAGRLIITQSPSAHRQIVDLLRKLRAGGSKEGTALPGDAR